MRLVLWVLLLVGAAQAGAQDIAEVRSFVNSQWSTTSFKSSIEMVRGFTVALGKMKKINGSWQPEIFKPVTGELRRETWQVTGTPVVDLFDETTELIAMFATLRYFCVSRECGNASEWASRIYQQRLLYGRDEFLRFAAFETPEGDWITVFSAARSADRQYLHVDEISPIE
jgi:hypothetical protein